MKGQLVTHQEFGTQCSTANTDIRIPKTKIRIAVNDSEPNAGVQVFRDHPGDDREGVTITNIEVPDGLVATAFDCLLAQEAFEKCEELVRGLIEQD